MMTTKNFLHMALVAGAGKALGAQYGASKKATLVVVRLHALNSEEFLEALEAIIEDLDRNPQRRKNSVINMSLHFGIDWDDDDIQRATVRFNALFVRDVPFVICSGNIFEDDDGPEVDTYPALLEGPDMPLIVVGSVNHKGEMSEITQAGPHVNIYAVGEDIVCMPKEGDETMEEDGTSFGMSLRVSNLNYVHADERLRSCAPGVWRDRQPSGLRNGALRYQRWQSCQKSEGLSPV